MMLTVSMMAAIFIKTWKTLEVSEAKIQTAEL